MNIDLKAYNAEFYQKVCGGNLEDVKRVIEAANEKCHVEITTLIVNGHNDSIEEIEDLAKWLSSINKNMPLHLSRYHPSYKFDAPATPVSTILKCVEISRLYLNYVYAGNISNVDSNTYCPVCGEMIICREGYNTEVLIDENICSKCKAELNIIPIKEN
jgi:pyruvate formate lyase activating enzyme